MKNLHAIPRATRLLLGTLAALALLAATSAAAAAASKPITSDQFAAGWEAHARPLFLMGQSRLADRDKWYVPGTLPRGDYVLVKRTGAKAELIDGYRFTVTSANINADLYMFLTPGQGDVQALPVEDVPVLKPKPARAAVVKQ